MVIAIPSAIVAILGLILYVSTTPPKWTEVGRILFFCGMLTLLFFTGSHAVKLF